MNRNTTMMKESVELVSFGDVVHKADGEWTYVGGISNCALMLDDLR